ncbi:hypothetical protein MHF_1364 [Mycoplasma haemofelis Ohio2]|uniref:Uncharacterized protein n=1 Tax=Mycoplasma haemofelis (strain Ohio2) TaxID=859194 RepID=F6FGA2_MYCHI|nr:hypothetical protein MHF_1364 [Mycoplasma haemofelis Ohio2]
MSIPSSILFKSTMAAGAAGGVLGGAYLAKPYLFPEKENIRSKLEKAGWEILPHTGNDSDWTAIYEKYKLKAANDLSRLDETVTQNEANNTGIPKLKKSCQSALSKEFSESLYKSAVRWCVVPVSVESRLQYLGGYTKINIDENNTSVDHETWKQREATFKSNSDKNSSDFGITFPASPSDQEANIKEIKKGCKKHLERKNYEDDFGSSIQNARRWCSK